MGLLTAVKQAIAGEDTERSTKDIDHERQLDSPAKPAHDGQSVTERPSETDAQVIAGLSTREALLELVEAHGGRIKQADLVRCIGRSKSTVSRHLSELERAGEVTRVQVGNCKIVGFPDDSLLAEHGQQR